MHSRRTTTTPTFVITAPHGHCLPTYDGNDPDRHECDFLARGTAIKLANALRRRCGRRRDEQPGAATATVHLLLPQTSRAECDLNRDVCLGHAYRQRVRRACQSSAGPVWQLDVHSFPPGRDAFELGDGLDDRAFDLVLLDNSDGRHHTPPGTGSVLHDGTYGHQEDVVPFAWYNDSLARHITNGTESSVCLVPGHVELNSINKEANTFPRVQGTLLLEFNETLASRPQEWDAVVDAIADWFCTNVV